MVTRSLTKTQRLFRVMGCDAHLIVIDGTDAHLDRAESRLRQLESLWNRFLRDSDVTRANQQAGTPVEVHRETIDIVLRAIEAWKQTRRLFDITVPPALTFHGYPHSTADAAAAPRVAEQMIGVSGGIIVDPGRGTITVPAGAAIDLGGIGRGYAGDVVADELRREGAAGVFVSIGGDIAVRGIASPLDPLWYIGVEDPTNPPNQLAQVAIVSGGIATSGTTTRWTRPDGQTAHHPIDPSTAMPAATSLLTATVIAADAATAAMFATAAMTGNGPRAVGILESVGLAGLMVATDGTVHRTESWEDFAR
jgi:FAD:protein FMN transferase